MTLRRGFFFILILTGCIAPMALLAQAAPGRYPAETDLIDVLFAPDSQVRLREGRLVDLSTHALDGVDAVLAGVNGLEWARLCDVPEAKLDDIQARGKANTGGEIYNLNNAYRLRFDDKSSALDAWALSRALEALPGVMQARPVPRPVPPPLPPDYDASQNYNDAASAVPTGIDARYGWSVTNGNGTGITVCDLEYSWNYNHQDLTKALGSQINTNVADPFSNTNHGTAVLGELISDANAPANWGTKGACYGANLKTCGTYYGVSPAWNPAGAIAIAVMNLNPGDVILLEQQWDYTTTGGYVPVEWYGDVTPGAQTYNAVYAAIVNAVAAGIHVVEAGGNGNVNTGLLNWYGDSGAIVVGAGGAYAGGTYPQGNLERLSFSSYGPRFNLQGWGENVVTTGYGALYSAEGVNLYYTNGFNGTSSASPIVAAAVADCEAYYIANISGTPLSPGAMRTLLVNTGTPQYFGLQGNIGPRPDINAAIQNMTPPVQYYDYGDAPEQAPAYPNLGIMGQFPTCIGAGAPGSFIQHAMGPLFLGPMVDPEPDGNGGNCVFPPYDMDECWNDGDSGLLYPAPYTIAAGTYVPCQGQAASLGTACTWAAFGTNLDVQVMNGLNQPAYLNVLADWDQNGFWQGQSQCGGGPAPEWAVQNWMIPAGFAGPASALGALPLLIGPNAGYVWCRFSITDVPVPAGWNGAGIFAAGETSDYLLQIDPESQSTDFGDAPEGAIAYPSGVVGQFPTCMAAGPAGFVSHRSTGNLYFGQGVDFEAEGNAGNCPNFPPYDADECMNDGDAGLVLPGSFTMGPGWTPQPCPQSPASPLGLTCSQALWGPNVDIALSNNTRAEAYVNVLMDWNQNGAWQGSSNCIGAPPAPEHVLVNLVVPPGFVGLLSALAPPPFRIGPNGGYVWTRFTLSDTPVLANWDGSGSFGDGETCDYLLAIEKDLTGIEESGAPKATRLLPAQPNPFRSATTIGFDLARAGAVDVAVFDIAGRRIRTMAAGEKAAGRFSMAWDGRNDAGAQVAAGMYFIRLRGESVSQSLPVILLR